MKRRITSGTSDRKFHMQYRAKRKIEKRHSIISLFMVLTLLVAYCFPIPVVEAEGGNNVNGGYMAEGDGYIFYRSMADSGKLYRAKPDGSEKKKLSDDSPYAITVSDGWIYYGVDAYLQVKSGLYKMRTDGTQRTKLSDDFAYSINVCGDTIYYAAYGIYSINTDGTQKKLLCKDGFYELVYDDGYLYFMKEEVSNYYEIYRMHTDGSGLKQLNRVNSAYMNIDGEYIYYNDVDNQAIIRMGIDGSNPTEIICNVNGFNKVGKYLYYENVGDHNNIYRCSIEGDERQKLTDQHSNRPGSLFLNKDMCLYGFGNNVYYINHEINTGDCWCLLPQGDDTPVEWDAEKQDVKPFSDVPQTHPAYNAIKYMNRAGILKGVTEDTYAPDETITRAEACTILLRIIGVSIDYVQKQENSINFTDVKESYWANKQIGFCYRHGLVYGFADGTFRPEKLLSLQEFLTVFIRCIQNTEDLSYPDGYLKQAKRRGLLEDTEYDFAVPITRGDAARILYSYYSGAPGI